LNCVFVYVIIPQTSINELIRQQAKKIIEKRFARVTASMVLEDQEVYGNEKKNSFEPAIEKLIDKMDKTFWDQ
jgi:hypothetical protein